ncbi:glucose-6-phosphate isomerase [Shouchella clausii]|uniref:Cupin type-1 domain-containing protein n=2 Tax=Bacillaceae TaxID=186817 RepID=Q5WCJ7_SHOC1|nr:glucose-6-phosphate isomerase [Shouchella clausii]PAD47579.1 cupin domain-containing protein [Shouchella clausii]PAE83268.1 glucose-6-phosphate isomerase [Shouchella clausii]PAF09433.1 glucose-6-phosphate isomerase [Shouchella clausii]BAD65913.1 conserved hypothetical protein [Shouchella clausii KSM-K16]
MHTMTKKGGVYMNTSVLQSPSLNLAGDSTRTLNYQRDPQNYITQLFAAQLPAIPTGFFNVHMSTGIVITPHWHTNASELVFVICGKVQASVFNPFSQKLLTYELVPGQAVVLPKGWFHWIVALTDGTHLLTIFDKPTPDIVYGSDFLRFLPGSMMELAYCVNGNAYENVVAPIQESVILGPPTWCNEKGQHPKGTASYKHYYTEHPQPQTYRY